MLPRTGGPIDLLRELGVPLLVLAALLAVLAWAVWAIRKWLRRTEVTAPSCEELLLEFRRMAEEGKLSEQEFRTIKERLMRQMQHRRPEDVA